MRCNLFSLAALGAAICLSAAPVSAGLLAFTNFQDEAGSTFNATFDKNHLQSTPTLVATGSNMLSNGFEGVAYTDSEGTEHIAGRAVAYGSGATSGDNQMLLTIDTTGFMDFSYRYDARATSVGAPGAAVSWRLGTTGAFTSLGTDVYTRDSTWYEITRDLSSLPINDAGTVQFLFTFLAGSGSGTVRVDNLELRGQAIPEPAAVLAGAGALCLLLRRRH